DKEVELDCRHMAFGISPAAVKDVVREVRRFLGELEPPASARSA
ncbi:MAG: hypothetical protein QOE50_664, partial [Sphingomonadales bacterium]|nr:hypothetical protein [Sphingomonadales bacterium]